MANRELKAWGAFGYLCLVWGASFLLIKIVVAEVRPFTLVTIRLGLATLGMWGIVLWRGISIPKDGRLIGMLVLLGWINTAVPFVLITWGQQFVSSSVTSILNSTTPLFTIVIANFALTDERMTVSRVGGLLIGFSGIVLIFSRGITAESFGLAGDRSILLGQGAVVLATLCYGIGLVATRRYLGDVNPLVIATVTITSAFSAVLLATLLIEPPLDLTLSLRSFVALLVLGLLGVSVAQTFFYYVIGEWGATRASLVTYIIPIVGVILGVLILNEPLDWRMLVGLVAVLVGVSVVNRRVQKS